MTTHTAERARDYLAAGHAPATVARFLGLASADEAERLARMATPEQPSPLAAAARRIIEDGRLKANAANLTKAKAVRLARAAMDLDVLVGHLAQRPMTLLDLSAATGVNTNTVHGRLERLIRQGRVAKAGRRGRAMVYDLASGAPDLVSDDGVAS
ncbi:MAG: hypothetical protein AAGJ87_15120 [Pseudomonadota bacterium]